VQQWPLLYAGCYQVDIAMFQMTSVPSYRRYAEEPDHASVERADPKADADRKGCHNVDRTGTQTIPTLIGSAEEFGANRLGCERDCATT
jgi:hypothetical protein